MKISFYSTILLLILGCNSPVKESTIEETSFCDKIHRNDSITLTSQLESVAHLMNEKTGVYVLEDGGGSLVTRAWLSEYAENTIDIQYFIFSTDNVGLIACDYLVRAADRGVKVRILLDDMMVDADISDIITLNSHKNITIKIYNPGMNLGKNIFGTLKKLATDYRSANQRMHNKTFIVDDKITITGGRNIADEYFDYNHEYNFRDRDVLLVGKVTKDVSSSFEDFWNSTLSVSPDQLVDKKSNRENEIIFDKLHEYACNPDNFWPQIRSKIENFPSTIQYIKDADKMVWIDDVSFISDNPGKNDGSEGLGGGGKSTSSLIALIQQASTTIDIQSPYLVTTALGQNLFREAVNRGVKVRILTNSLASTDNLEAFAGYQKDRQKLLETGVEIFEFRPDAAERTKIMTGELQQTIDFKPIFGLHAKSMVIDGNITVIGTFNLDPRSANLNTECITVIHSEKVAQGVLSGMETEFLPENSWQTTLTSNPDDEAGNMKQVKTWTRKILPKNIL